MQKEPDISGSFFSILSLSRREAMKRVRGFGFAELGRK